MRQWIAAAAICALSVGPALAETREVGAFHQVNAADRLEVEVVSGADYAVDVTGADADRVRIRVEGGTLKISDARRPWFGSGRHLDAVVRVAAPEIDGVAAARGAELSATLNQADCAGFSAAAAMGGTVTAGGLRCRSVSAAAAMGAEVELSGSCDRLEVSAAMGADIDTRALECRRAEVSAAMGADVSIYASQSYEASAAMGASVDVTGGGAVADASTALGGSVSHN